MRCILACLFLLLSLSLLSQRTVRTRVKLAETYHCDTIFVEQNNLKNFAYNYKGVGADTIIRVQGLFIDTIAPSFASKNLAILTSNNFTFAIGWLNNQYPVASRIMKNTGGIIEFSSSEYDNNSPAFWLRYFNRYGWVLERIENRQYYDIWHLKRESYKSPFR